MRKGLLVLLVALLAGTAVFFAMRRQKGAERHPTASGIAMDAMPELDWLKSDLKLSDAQFDKVRELHLAYRPRCVEMCRLISVARARAESITMASRELTAESKAAIEELARVRAECQQAMLKHLYETAATLNAEQEKQYLETMLPFALEQSHQEPGTYSTHAH